MSEANEVIGKIGQNLQELMKNLGRVIRRDHSTGEKVKLGAPNFVLNGSDFIALIFSKDGSNQTRQIRDVLSTDSSGLYKLSGTAQKGIRVKDISVQQASQELLFPAKKKIYAEKKVNELNKMKKEMAKLF